MKKNIQNEHGFVLITSMMMLVVLMVIGIAATNTTMIELQIAGNDRVTKTDFYNQEMGLTIARVISDEWLTSNFVTEPIGTAHFPKENPAPSDDANNNNIDDRAEVLNPSNEVVSIYKVRNIVSPATTIDDWDDIDDFVNAAAHPANQIPVLSHEDKPPVGSGYDPKNFYIKRFAITAYLPDDDRAVVLQEGVFKGFNKN